MSRFLRRHGLLIALLALVTLAALPVLTYPLGRDQGEFATLGRGILQGKVPYVDLWNPKPPAVFYIYALAMALFGQTSMALRALDLFVVPLVMIGLYGLGARLSSRRLGLLAAVVFPVFYLTETFWTLTQNDGIALVPMVLAMVCAVHAADGGRRALWWAFAAGALSAWALWFKYPFVFFILALIAGYCALTAPARRARGRLYDWRAWLGFSAGGLIVGVGGLAYLAALGALGALIQSVVVTSSYTALGFGGDFVQTMRDAAAVRWQYWGLPAVLAVGWPLLQLPALARRIGRERLAGWLLVWLWLLAGAAAMLIQAKGYDYHWLPLLPPLALLAASTLDRVARLVGRADLLRALASAALLTLLVVALWRPALPYLLGHETEIAYATNFQAGEFVAAESLEVADYLRARVAPGDSLFIWGFRPEVYYLSGLNPATRFIFQFPLVAGWYPPEWKKQTVETLWAALPPYVLVLQVDYMPWVTGSHDDSNTLLQGYTELNNWLIFNYERETQIGNFFLWKRKPSPA